MQVHPPPKSQCLHDIQVIQDDHHIVQTLQSQGQDKDGTHVLPKIWIRSAVIICTSWCAEGIA